MTRPEQESILAEYDQLSSSLDDYAEIAIGFGYTALFVTALPIAALFLLLAVITEIKTDGWKLIHLHSRPFPKGCEDIGSWQSIFLLLSIISVLTNAGLVTFTMTTLQSLSLVTRFWIFVVFQWVCFTLQMVIMELIPDVPEEIDIQLARTEFIVRKLIDKVADDDETDEFENTEETESDKLLPLCAYPDGTEEMGGAEPITSLNGRRRSTLGGRSGGGQRTQSTMQKTSSSMVGGPLEAARDRPGERAIVLNVDGERGDGSLGGSFDDLDDDRRSPHSAENVPLPVEGGGAEPAEQMRDMEPALQVYKWRRL